MHKINALLHRAFISLIRKGATAMSKFCHQRREKRHVEARVPSEVAEGLHGFDSEKL